MKRYYDRTLQVQARITLGVKPMSHTSLSHDSGAGRSPGEPVQQTPQARKGNVRKRG